MGQGNSPWSSEQDSTLVMGVEVSSWGMGGREREHVCNIHGEILRRGFFLFLVLGEVRCKEEKSSPQERPSSHTQSSPPIPHNNKALNMVKGLLQSWGDDNATYIFPQNKEWPILPEMLQFSCFPSDFQKGMLWPQHFNSYSYFLSC